ncbi:MAG: carboxypeptidase-like regulatory domain-containing protein, partial [Nanoarchaeota archaeon]
MPRASAEVGCCFSPTYGCQAGIQRTTCIDSAGGSFFPDSDCTDVSNCIQICCCDSVGHGNVISQSACSNPPFHFAQNPPSAYVGSPQDCTTACGGKIVEPGCPPVCTGTGGPGESFFIEGKLIDQTGGNVVGAYVDLKERTDLRAISYSDGSYKITGIPNSPPDYTVRASKPGCDLAEYTPKIPIAGGSVSDVNIQLNCQASGACLPENPVLSDPLPVPKAPSAGLSWTLNNNCDGQVNNYVLWRCDENQENCINVAQGQTLQTFTDTALSPRATYCYIVDVYIQVGSDMFTKTSRDETVKHCLTLGDAECLREHDLTFCVKSETVDYAADCLQNNVLHPLDDCKVKSQFCIVKSTQAQCVAPQSCDNCTGFLAMFSFLNPNLEVDYQYETACSNSQETFCYLDKEKVTQSAATATIVDVFNSCQYVTKCADYKSKENCQGATADPCKVLNQDCAWIDLYAPELGLGSCSLSEEQQAPCEQCVEIFEGVCTQRRCESLSKGTNTCYWNNDANIRGEQNNKCVSARDMACAYYDTKDACEGNPPINFQADVAYDTRLNHRNERIGNHNNQPLTGGISKDIFSFGRCKWDSINCYKDADSHFFTYETGALTMWKSDDCEQGITSQTFTGYSDQELLSCLKDTAPPTTTLTLKTPAEYTLDELARGEFFFVDDAEGALGKRILGNPKLYTRFCVYDPAVDSFCYPNLTYQQLSGEKAPKPGSYTLRYYAFDDSLNLETVQAVQNFRIVQTDGAYITRMEYDGLVHEESPPVLRTLRPEIKIVFSEPVNISPNFPVLFDTDDNQYTLVETGHSEDKSEYTYEVRERLLPGKSYHIDIFYQDKSAPIVRSQVRKDFAVQTSFMSMDIVSPKIFYSVGSTPDLYIISPRSPFTFTLALSRGGQPIIRAWLQSCMVGPDPDTLTKPINDINGNQISIPSSDLSWLVSDPASDTLPLDDYFKEVWISCKEQAPSLYAGQTSLAVFKVGIDTRVPVFQVDKTPETITNYGNPLLNLSLVRSVAGSSDDLVQCSYTFQDTIVLFDASENPADFNDYTPAPYLVGNHPLLDFSFVGQYPPPENIQPHTFTIPVNCTNRAGLWAFPINPVSVTVDFSEVFHITLAKPAGGTVNSSSLILNISTSVPTPNKCNYTINRQAQPGKMAQSTDQKSYQSTMPQAQVVHSWNNGPTAVPNNVTVECSISVGFVRKDFTFIADLIKPIKPDINISNSQGIGCSATQLTARFNSTDNGTGVQGYVVSLRKGANEFLVQNRFVPSSGVETSFTFQEASQNQIQNSDSFTWLVKAMDFAGNVGDEQQKQLKVEPTNLACRIPLHITTKIPRLGISSAAATFPVELETDRKADCRWSLFNKSRFEEYQGFFTENPPAPQAFTISHKISSFNSRTSGGIVYVKCMDEDTFYHDGKVYLNYDPSAPVFTYLDIVPNPVVDPVRKYANISFETDDNTSCMYNSIPVQPYDLDDFFSFSKKHSFIINYSNIYDFDPHTFYYTLTCTNGAEPDLSASRNFNVTVDLSDSVIITLKKPGEFTNQRT